MSIVARVVREFQFVKFHTRSHVGGICSSLPENISWLPLPRYYWVHQFWNRWSVGILELGFLYQVDPWNCILLSELRYSWFHFSLLPPEYNSSQHQHRGPFFPAVGFRVGSLFSPLSAHRPLLSFCHHLILDLEAAYLAVVLYGLLSFDSWLKKWLWGAFWLFCFVFRAPRHFFTELHI